jgi:hypothetical protein
MSSQFSEMSSHHFLFIKTLNNYHFPKEIQYKYRKEDGSQLIMHKILVKAFKRLNIERN